MLLLAPASASFAGAEPAGLPEPVGDRYTVQWFYFLSTAGGSCWDQLHPTSPVSVAGALGSYARFSSSAPGWTRADLYLKPTDGSCAPLKLSFDYPLEPLTAGAATGAGPCGTPTVTTYRGTTFEMTVQMVLAPGCAAPHEGTLDLQLAVTLTRPDTAYVCEPVLGACGGAYEEADGEDCSDGRASGWTSVSPVASAERWCGEQGENVDIYVGLASVHAGDWSGCYARVGLLVTAVTATCSDEVRYTLVSIPWGHLIP